MDKASVKLLSRLIDLNGNMKEINIAGLKFKRGTYTYLLTLHRLGYRRTHGRHFRGFGAEDRKNASVIKYGSARFETNNIIPGVLNL